MLLILRKGYEYIQSRVAVFFYGVLALLILGPLLTPGYILTLDMAWVPEINVPSIINNTYGLYVVLAALNQFIPSDILQKFILAVTLWGVGYGAYRLVDHLYRITTNRTMPLPAALAAGLLATVNPYVYARFTEGHWQVLIGYAVLPWLAWRLLLLVNRPTLSNAAWWAATLIVLTMAGSVHMILMGILFCAAIVIGCLVRRQITRKVIVVIASALGVVAALNLTWIIPSVVQGGSIADKISSFDYRHDATFRTRGLGWVPPELNILTLHGYWGEAEGRFAVVQRINPLWLLLFMAIACIAIYGLIALWRQNRARRLTWSLIGLAVCAWILSVGTYSKLFGWLNSILSQNVPFFAGYREPQKFAAILALTLAIFFGIGMARLLERASNDTRQRRTFMAIGLLLPILYTPLLFLGSMGQLRSTDYPPAWYQLNERFASEGGDFSVVFLPWHNYLYFEPAGRTVANPAVRFFTNARIIQSEEPNIGLIPLGQRTEPARAVQTYLIDQNESAHAAQILADNQVKYILIAKIADWEQYRSTMTLPGFTSVSETPTTQLYRNEFYHDK